MDDLTFWTIYCYVVGAIILMLGAAVWCLLNERDEALLEIERLERELDEVETELSLRTHH